MNKESVKKEERRERDVALNRWKVFAVFISFHFNSDVQWFFVDRHKTPSKWNQWQQKWQWQYTNLIYTYTFCYLFKLKFTALSFAMVCVCWKGERALPCMHVHKQNQNRGKRVVAIVLPNKIDKSKNVHENFICSWFLNLIFNTCHCYLPFRIQIQYSLSFLLYFVHFVMFLLLNVVVIISFFYLSSFSWH